MWDPEMTMQVICPTAPMLPVTLNGGMSMPAWYDILSLDEADPHREDMEGVDWAVNFVQESSAILTSMYIRIFILHVQRRHLF